MQAHGLSQASLPLERSSLPGDASGDSRRLHEPVVATRLWLALHLPRFPLEALGGERGLDRPVAVITGTGAATRVVAASASAAAGGVDTAMSASAACALVPELLLVPRDEAAETAALEGLAAWAGQFTSFVSLVPPRGLLLEIGGSLAFFGGLEPLLTRVRDAVADLGYSARSGVAPTPLGAWLLARAGLEEPVTTLARLPAGLAPVPYAGMILADFGAEVIRVDRPSTRPARAGWCTTPPTIPCTAAPGACWADGIAGWWCSTAIGCSAAI